MIPLTTSMLPTDIIPPHSAPGSEHVGSSGGGRTLHIVPQVCQYEQLSSHAHLSIVYVCFAACLRPVRTFLVLLETAPDCYSPYRIHLPNIPIPQPVLSSMHVEAMLYVDDAVNYR